MNFLFYDFFRCVVGGDSRESQSGSSEGPIETDRRGEQEGVRIGFIETATGAVLEILICSCYS